MNYYLANNNIKTLTDDSLRQKRYNVLLDYDMILFINSQIQAV